MNAVDHDAGRPVRPKLVYLVTEDWYFLSHRLPMALAAKHAGYDVHVATRVDRPGAASRRMGFTLHPLDWRRGSLNPLDLICDHTAGTRPVPPVFSPISRIMSRCSRR